MAGAQLTAFRLVNPQTVSATSTGSAASSIITEHTEFIRLVPADDGYFATGSSTVTVTSTSGHFLESQRPEIFAKNPKHHYIAWVPASTSSQTLYISECT